MSSYLTTGTKGTLGTEWEVQNSRRNQVARYYGMTQGYSQLDFHSYLAGSGVDDNVVLDQIEFDILGVDKQAGEKLLNWTDSAWSAGNADDRLFQSEKHSFFTNIDLDNGVYEVMDEQGFTEKLGMDWSGGKPYDVIDITNNNIDFSDFVFSGTGDGRQDSLSINLNNLNEVRWGASSYNIVEVDTTLALADKDDKNVESLKAHNAVDIMLAEADKWLTDNMKKELATLSPSSKEYEQKLKEFAFQMFDNEGYLNGNEIKSPSEKEVAAFDYSANGQFSVRRGEDGQVLVGLQGVDNLNVSGLGAVSGDAVLSMGKTQGNSNESVIQVGQTVTGGKANVVVDTVVKNQEYYGDNVNADYNSSKAAGYNVQWNADNGTLDSSKSNAAMTVQTGEKADNNTFSFGTAGAKIAVEGYEFDNMYIDNGKNNTVTTTSNSSNYFETTKTSKGANITGGDNGNYFIVDGDNGVLLGGKGNDTFITGKNAEGNILAGRDGDDTLKDFGTNTFFSGGKGKDSVELNGKGAFAQMGNGEDYEARISGSDNQVWAGNEITREKTPEMSKSEQLYYNYKSELDKYMIKNNISFDSLMDRLKYNSEDVVKEIMNSIKNNK